MSGLVAHYPLHEWSGSQANDVSGNGNHGTVNGATQGVWGRGGLTAYSFDGSGDYVNFGSIGIGEPHTISLWFKSDQWTDGYDTLHDLENVWFRRHTNGNIQYEMRDSNDNFVKVSVPEYKFPTDKWIHAVLKFDNDNLYMYKNGEILGVSKNTNGISTSGDAYIGSSTFETSSRAFNGSIADVRIYNRALSPQEIQTLYEWGSEDYTPQSLHDGTDSGSVSRYTFDGDVTEDSWGSNTLTDNTSAGTATDAIRGDAKSFDGTDDYMDIGTLPAEIFGSEYTVSAWFKQTVDNASPAIDFNNGTESIEIYPLYGGTSPDVIITTTDGTDELRTQFESVAKNEWIHLIVVVNGDTSYGYLNGVLRDSDTNSSFSGISSDLTNCFIGLSGSSYYTGDIDDVRIYDRALSDREVFDLYRWGSRGKDQRKTLVKQ